jgi:phage gp36-like protein
MAYITLAKIRGALPQEVTAQLLDDSGSGAPDSGVWAEIVARVTAEIDGKIGQRYPLPLATVPPLIENAAFILAAELCYQRRNFFGDANPWTKRADGIRGTKGQQGGQAGLLDDIASGAQPLTFAAKPARPSGSIISEQAKTTPSSGGMLC